VEIPTKVELRLESIVSEVATKSEFQPLDHALEIEGRCSRCA
jgi:Fe2+ or Zn2+ uptake regulation protein